MITFFQAIVLGLVQGVTELFPVSSLGHSVLLPGLLGWNINQNAEGFLEFLVATHLATALVLFAIYFKDWVRIIKGMIRSFVAREIKDSDPDAKLGWLLVMSTIPAGIIGLLLKDQITGSFLSPRSAAFFLMMNGILLFLAERLRKNARIAETTGNNDVRIAGKLSWWQAVKIGLLQVLALIPGFSRTGSTLAGGLLSGLSHEDSLRYSFLLATPIIGAAALLELPPLISSGGMSLIGVTIVGAITAAGAAWFSVKFLTRYFKTKTLTPFAIYCLAVGIVGLFLLR
jgi:undecaprenyl-diphosphatase